MRRLQGNDQSSPSLSKSSKASGIRTHFLIIIFTKHSGHSHRSIWVGCFTVRNVDAMMVLQCSTIMEVCAWLRN